MRRLLVPIVAVAVLGLPALAAAEPNPHCPDAVNAVRGTQPTRAQITAAIHDAAVDFDVPEPVLRAIAYVESEWTQFRSTGEPVLSTDGVCGVGIMQVTADGRYTDDEKVRLAEDYAYNVAQGALILAEKWTVAAQTPPPADSAPDDRDVIENWYYPIYLYNGDGGSPVYPDKVANVVHAPFRYAPNFGLAPYYFTKPQDADPTYVFPNAFQARNTPDAFVFYDHTTGVVQQTVGAPVHHLSEPAPRTSYGTNATGPDGHGVTCTQCGGWRLADGVGLAGRAHWTNSVTGPVQSAMVWHPLLINGPDSYRVRAHVPALGDETLGTATYLLGDTPVTVDQDAVKGGWHSFGIRILEPGDTVTLVDKAAVGGRKLVGDGLEVTAVPTLRVRRGAAVVTYGTGTTLTVRMTHGGVSFGGTPHTFTLYKRPMGTAAWRAVGTYALDDLHGDKTIAVRPASNTEYYARYHSPDAFFESVSSAVTRVVVRTRVAAGPAYREVPAGRSASFVATVAPNHAGRKVVLQRRVNGTWQNAVSGTLDADSRVRFTVSKPRGTYYYRVYAPAHSDHWAGATGTLKLVVY